MENPQDKPNWERSVLEKIALEGLTEQRRRRRWGIFFKLPSLAGGASAVATSLLLLMTAIRDERECIGFFGDEYRVYMKRTRRFIPVLF